MSSEEAQAERDSQREDAELTEEISAHLESTQLLSAVADGFQQEPLVEESQEQVNAQLANAQEYRASFSAQVSEPVYSADSLVESSGAAEFVPFPQVGWWRWW